MPSGLYTEKHCSSLDGLNLYYRTYGDRDAKGTPVLCLAGLTRNSRDFDELAPHLCKDRYVICPDYRGRGKSDHAPDFRSYSPENYVMDLAQILMAEQVPRVTVIGTSLGGLLGLAVSSFAPDTIAGLLLNDVGPDIGGDGEGRIMDLVGNDERYDSLEDAIVSAKKQLLDTYPDWTEDNWMTYARATFTYVAEDNNYGYSYDMRLRDALLEQIANNDRPDLWGMFEGIADRPVMLVHGERSDVLDRSTIDRMMEVKPDLRFVGVANRGHVPTLTEPHCLPDVLDFVRSLDATASA